MKQLIAGIVILLVVGIGAFVYRNALENPGIPIAEQPVACTSDAMLCPDGSSVGRTGPDCAFSACPFPNVEVAHTAFAVPALYHENKAARGTDATLVAAFEKASLSESVQHSIVVRDFLIPAGKSATSTIIANTMYAPSGMSAKALSEFKPKIINAKTFYCATLERFEAQVHTVCYLARATDVLRFEVLERDVVEWTNPKLVIDTLPEHQAFYRMLTTLELR